MGQGSARQSGMLQEMGWQRHTGRQKWAGSSKSAPVPVTLQGRGGRQAGRKAGV